MCCCDLRGAVHQALPMPRIPMSLNTGCGCMSCAPCLECLARSQRSVETIGKWKDAYSAAAARVNAAIPARPWAPVAGSSFAHVDAFVQRCSDLLEMGAAHRQFAADAHLRVRGQGWQAGAELCRGRCS